MPTENVHTTAGASEDVLADTLLTPADVAKKLRVSLDWVRSHANGNRQPGLRAVSLGKLLRFRQQDVEEFIRSRLSEEPARNKMRIH